MIAALVNRKELHWTQPNGKVRCSMRNGIGRGSLCGDETDERRNLVVREDRVSTLLTSFDRTILTSQQKGRGLWSESEGSRKDNGEFRGGPINRPQ